MENICLKIVRKLISISNMTSTDDDIEVYTYGLLSYVYTLIPLIVLFVFSIFFHKPIEMLTWVIIFLCLRKYSGGYHAKSPTLCFVYSILLGLSCLVLCEFMPVVSPLIYFICILVNSMLLFFLAPATNKQFTSSARFHCKIKVIALIFLLSFVFIVLFDFRLILLHALSCTSLLCIAQKIEKCYYTLGGF